MNSKLIILISIVSLIKLSKAIEQPSYQLIQKLDQNTEIRKYAPSKWVSTSVRALCSSADMQKKVLFQRLFGYISGQNDKNQKIQMTSPVLTEMNKLNEAQNECEIVMRFYIPKENQLNTPKPTGDAFLTDLNEITVAVSRFGGFATLNDYLTHRTLLSEKLGNQLSSYDSVNMITAGYSSPMQLFDRINEVWLRKF